MKRFSNMLTLFLSAISLGSCQVSPNSREAVLLQMQSEMNPTAKNLRKLAEVPFFKNFSKEELNWVDQHTDEYGFSAGENVPTEGEMENVYWILLYGSWTIEHDTGSVKVTNLGSWFQRANSAKDNFKALNAGSTSYILMVSEESMRFMKEQNYPLPSDIM